MRHENYGGKRPLVAQINDAIRENPLAAGFIGAGVAWMLFGSKGVVQAGTMATSAVRGTATGLASAAVGLGEVAQNATKSARRLVEDTGSAAASIIPDVTPPSLEKAKSQAAEGVQTVTNGLRGAAVVGNDFASTLRANLTAGFKRQPLLLGALGLAIGASVASSFATTPSERTWLGEESDKARERLREVGSEAKLRVQKAGIQMQKEADRQGLSVDAAKEAVRALADKAKTVATTVNDQPSLGVSGSE